MINLPQCKFSLPQEIIIIKTVFEGCIIRCCYFCLNSYSYRYANNVQTGNYVLLARDDELVPEKVTTATTSTMQGKNLCHMTFVDLQ